MLDNDYCKWDMLDEDLTTAPNMKLKHTTDLFLTYGMTSPEEDTLPANTTPTRFHAYEENPQADYHYKYQDEEEFVPMVAALRF